MIVFDIFDKKNFDHFMARKNGFRVQNDKTGDHLFTGYCGTK